MWQPNLQVEILELFAEAQSRPENAAIKKRLRIAWDKALYKKEFERVSYSIDRFLRLRSRPIAKLPRMLSQRERSFRCPMCHSRSSAHRCPGQR